ncbi:MAG: hypothetical protein M3Y73_13945, partial [Actinomycetota bacterium]|nr:hypothetical protein [Actinomycetota bacterium]
MDLRGHEGLLVGRENLSRCCDGQQPVPPVGRRGDLAEILHASAGGVAVVGSIVPNRSVQLRAVASRVEPRSGVTAAMRRSASAARWNVAVRQASRSSAHRTECRVRDRSR